VFTIAGSLIAPRGMDRQTENLLRIDPQLSDHKLAIRFFGRTIVRYAFLEGGAILNLVLQLVAPSFVHCLVFVILVALMGLLIPTGESGRRWMARRREGAAGRRVL
jgi:hypothetical protein